MFCQLGKFIYSRVNKTLTIHKAKRATLMGARAHGMLTRGATINPRALYLQALGRTGQGPMDPRSLGTNEEGTLIWLQFYEPYI